MDRADRSDYLGAIHPGRNQVAPGDFEVHARVVQKPIDPCHRMFRGGGPSPPKLGPTDARYGASR